jgi:hypothetical protein
VIFASLSFLMSSFAFLVPSGMRLEFGWRVLRVT